MVLLELHLLYATSMYELHAVLHPLSSNMFLFNHQMSTPQAFAAECGVSFRDNDRVVSPKAT